MMLAIEPLKRCRVTGGTEIVGIFCEETKEESIKSSVEPESIKQERGIAKGWSGSVRSKIERGIVKDFEDIEKAEALRKTLLLAQTVSSSQLQHCTELSELLVIFPGSEPFWGPIVP